MPSSDTLRAYRAKIKQQNKQHELRKLMNQQKAQSAETTKPKIDSPLAKYNEHGQLTCILCKSIVRTEDVWKVHINAKQHKQNIELARQLKEKTNNFTKAVKRPASPPSTSVPEKVPRGILKNASTKSTATATATTSATNAEPKANETNEIPVDFFDNPKSAPQTSNYFQATLHKTNIRHDLVHIKRGADEPMDVEEAKDDALPEGFFDDPIKDAKARNTEYKDPVEEEWEKFQQEIKEQANFSNAIMAEDQEEATTERQIDEIDEQIRNWSRVLELEKKKEEVQRKEKEPRKIISEKVPSDNESDENEETGDIDEYLDWRAKNASK